MTAAAALEPDIHRLALHGLPVEIRCEPLHLSGEISRTLGVFGVAGWPEGFSAIRGSISYFDQPEVLKHLSPHAQQVSFPNQSIELYEDGERFWVVDDRWGMCEISLLKREWRSWVLPEPRLDVVRCLEQAVLWPMAQLLRPRGLHLLPAVSLAWAGRGTLVLSPFSIEPELSTLVRAGYRMIGQRWTALREEDGKVSLLHVPGQVERPVPPRLRFAAPDASPQWVNLVGENPGAWQPHAFCQTVLVIEPGRRANAELRPIGEDAAQTIRAAWPIIELHPLRRHPILPPRLAQVARCFECSLSRNPADLLANLQALHRSGGGTVTDARPTLTLHPQRLRIAS